MSNKKVVLISVIGTSPAVLTETVWALAHQKKPIVPDEVVVFTTARGKDDLKRAILSGKPNVWEQLKDALKDEKAKIAGKLVFTEHFVKVMLDANGQEMEDLRTADDNYAAADFMLQEIRGHATSDKTIICSIAGGRKTMSALLFSCMTLLGREDDKVYHVLIDPKYDSGMEPPFFFPQKGVSHELLSRGRRTGKKVPSTKIGIELFEVPFVSMFGLYQEKFNSVPPSYRTLVSRMRTTAPTALTFPTFKLDACAGTLEVDGKPCPLHETCFALLLLSFKGIHDIDGLYDMLMKMAGARFQDASKIPVWFSNYQASDRVNRKSDGRYPDLTIVSKLATATRAVLRKAECSEEVIDMILPKRGKPGARIPAAYVSVSGDSFLADILGCP